MEHGTTAGLRNSVGKAERIWQGERPLQVLSGPKVRNFYRAMMGDENAMTVDRWMLRAVGWPTDTITNGQYDLVANAIRQASLGTGLTPAQYQAAVWVKVRGGHA